MEEVRAGCPDRDFFLTVLSREKIVQFSSVTQSCPTLCDPMNCSTPGLPAHHQLPEFIQTPVHRAGDAIQPSHPLSFPSPPPSIFPSIRVFLSESALHIRWPKYWSFSFSISPSKECPGLLSFRMDWLDLLAVQGSLSFKYTYISSVPSLRPEPPSQPHPPLWVITEPRAERPVR